MPKKTESPLTTAEIHSIVGNVVDLAATVEGSALKDSGATQQAMRSTLRRINKLVTKGNADMPLATLRDRAGTVVVVFSPEDHALVALYEKLIEVCRDQKRLFDSD
jgi:hypothetical protein